MDTHQQVVLMKFGAEAFDMLWEQFCDGDLENTEMLTELGVKLGLVQKVPFDPEQHHDDLGDSDAGDDWFILSKDGWTALRFAAAGRPW